MSRPVLEGTRLRSFSVSLETLLRMGSFLLNNPLSDTVSNSGAPDDMSSSSYQTYKHKKEKSIRFIIRLTEGEFSDRAKPMSSKKPAHNLLFDVIFKILFLISDTHLLGTHMNRLHF